MNSIKFGINPRENNIETMECFSLSKPKYVYCMLTNNQSAVVYKSLTSDQQKKIDYQIIEHHKLCQNNWWTTNIQTFSTSSQ